MNISAFMFVNIRFIKTCVQELHFEKYHHSLMYSKEFKDVKNVFYILACFYLGMY